jgi:hypothetical protein
MFRFLNNVRVKVFKTFSIFLPHPPHMRSRSLDKFRDFQTSFEFYTILNPFYLTISIMHREPNVRNLASFSVHGLRDVL